MQVYKEWGTADLKGGNTPSVKQAQLYHRSYAGQKWIDGGPIDSEFYRRPRLCRELVVKV